MERIFCCRYESGCSTKNGRTPSGAGIRIFALKGTKPRKRPEPPESPTLQMQHAGFEQVGFQFVPVDLDTRRKAPPALFEHLSVVEWIGYDIAISR